MKWNIGEQFKVVKGNALAETALSAADYPASGSYIDVSGFEWVNVMIHLGTIHSSDTPNFELKAAEAANGTLDQISATYCAHHCANDDDGEFVHFALEVATLPVDHHFVSVVVTDVANGSYGDIVFYLCGARTLPVTQTSTVLPTASTHEWAG